MEDKKPLLSICIPTYNRAELLDKCIASIVSQKEFDSEDVELVISDNASNDNTEEIVKKYQEQYKNIFYSKNEENVTDKNFPIVIGNAHGEFRKLFHDNIIYCGDCILHLLKTINEHLDKKPVLFFLNRMNGREQEEYYNTDNFDSFILIALFNGTNIENFGIWKDDFDKLEDKFSGCSLHLWTAKVLFETIARKKEVFIDNRQLFSILLKSKIKDLSYGFFKVHYSNYMSLLHKYQMMQILSEDTVKYVKKCILFDIFSFIFEFKYNGDAYVFSPEEDLKTLIKLVKNEYCKEPYYYKWKIAFIKKEIRRFRKSIFSKKRLKHKRLS
jgi:glycosyltransferase involved in cell wall biosynthesis